MWRAIRSIFSNASALAGNAKGSPAAGHDGHATNGRVTIVGLVPGEQDRNVLNTVGANNGWDMRFAATCAEARAAFAHRRVPVILCDRDLPSADWRDAIQLLASTSRPTCVILVSSVVDDYLWEEVIRRGGYDVLSKPLRQDEVVRTLKLAWSFWNSMIKLPAYSGSQSSLNIR